MDCSEVELSVLFTDDVHMAALNSEYLDREGPTDVLSFPMNEGGGVSPESPLLGDIVISVDTAQRESLRLQEPLERTVDRLLMHGLLHLLGYDHEDTSPSKAERMAAEERRLTAMIAEE